MSYRVLARKWRPQIFTDVVGQKHVVTALANALSLGRIHHAYLFSGTRGVGKTSIARLLAKGLNCEISVTATPCGKCRNCCEIERGCFIDLIEIDAASRTKVEDTRDLLDNIQYSPARGRFKIYLIDEVHMLSRHSFNALLKTLEEPPEHVKFLLATTDPRKLPVTILSRCLQFHLKVLDTEQICTQLEHILNAENIVYEFRALQLLARAADGSLRDALNLTDQAIISGGGKLVTEVVSNMLGTLDNSQALSLVEAVINANAKGTLSLVNSVAARGIEWETLLTEMLAILHRLAMLQLSPLAIGADMADIEQRLRELARNVPPNELQLYYQILLIGRKELPFAPDGRMGVEMTLLRLLAFHPRTLLSESEASHHSLIPEEPSAIITTEQVQPHHPKLLPKSNRPPSGDTNLILSARNQFKPEQEVTKSKKNKLSTSSKAWAMSDTTVKRQHSITEYLQSRIMPSILEQKIKTKREPFHSKVAAFTEEVKVAITAQQTLQKALEHEKITELTEKLDQETIIRDVWSAEVRRLRLPKVIQQVALNAWKEQEGNRICLHLRPTQRQLNSLSAQKVLTEALSKLYGTTIELSIVEDNNTTVLTPLEWRQAIYEEKLAQARETIIADDNIQILRQFFNANLDEESICPV